MYKIYREISNSAKFPLAISRGSEKQRFNKAKAMTNLVAKKMDSYNSNIWNVKCLNYFLHETVDKYKINFDILPEINEKYYGSVGTKLDVISYNSIRDFMKSKTGIELPNIPIFKKPCIHIKLNGFEIKIKLKKDGATIDDKYTAIHEIRHFFDHLLNPKLSTNRSSDIFKYPKEYSAKFESIYMGVYKKFTEEYKIKSMKEFKKNIKKEMSVLPCELRIVLLQGIRSRLKLENNAYSHELRARCKNPIKNMRRIIHNYLFVKNNLQIKAKLNFVNEYLEELIAAERKNISKNNH